MGLFTSFMVSMVEYSQVASISVILLILTLMLVYILRLVSLDLLNGFPGGVVRVSGISNHVHRRNMAKKDLQWTIRVMSNSNPIRNENADLTSQEITFTEHLFYTSLKTRKRNN